MTTYVGHEGSVSIGNTVAEVKDFSLEISANTVDATTLGDTWQQSRVINRSFTVNVNCIFDDGATNGQIDMQNELMDSDSNFYGNDGVALSLSDGSQTWTGTVLITSMSTNVSVDGFIEASFTAVGKGTLAVS